MSDSIGAGPQARGRMLRLTLLLLAILLIIANGVVALVSVAQLREANARMAHSLRIIGVLKAIEDLEEDSSRNQRGFRVFADPQRLEAFRTAQAALPAQLQRLHDLTADDPGMADEVAQLSSLVEQDSAILAATLTPVETRPDTGSQPPEIAASVQRGNAIEAKIGELLERQETAVDKRIDVISLQNIIELATAVFAVVTSIVLVGVIFAMMRRDLRRGEQLAARHFGALRESEHRFHRIFDGSPLGIVLAQADTQCIVQANPAFRRMLGLNAAQVIGSSIADLVHVDDREVLREAVRTGNDSDLDIEVRYVTRSGVVTWARVHLTHLSALEGRPGLLLALTEDITREKRVEAELRQAQKMEAIGQLTGGIAHDFNNLLGVIIGNAEFLIDALGNVDHADLAREVLNAALSGADLTRRLLAFARQQPLQPRQIDLNAYLPSHIAILRRLLGESIAIATTLAADLWPIRADPPQIGDALLNLAINARDAMPHGGTISIATANVRLAGCLEDVGPGDYVVLTVTDTGIGMSPEVLERAVEPYFSTKAPRAGSGLGLSMIFGFAKQSGGHMRIESDLGRGTTVRLYLPRTHGMGQYEADEAVGAPLLQGNESILLVDDNEEMRGVARRHLVALGYRVSEAGSGPAAIENLMAGHSFDLLLTDVIMPEGMTGYQLAAVARQLRPGLKVVFTTGYSRPDPGDETEGDVTLRKPYRRQELAATVRAVLEAP